MKKLLALLTICFLLQNCDSKPVEKPKDLVSKDMMVDILYDLYVVNAMKSSDMEYLKKNNITPAKYIFEKYKVDSLQFSRSDRYYATDIETYEKLHERVTKRLQDDKAAIDSLLAKNPEDEEIKDSVAKPPVTPYKVRDSLRKNRTLRSAFFKDSVKNQ